jgi:hypothetical protein
LILNKSIKELFDTLIQYVIIYLLLISTILGGTIFDTFQIVLEGTALLFLFISILRKKISANDLIFLSIFFIASLASFVFNTFSAFALNFKIYGLCIFTFINFKNTTFYPRNLIILCIIFNVALIIYQFFTGYFIVPSGWFLSYYQGYTNSRPLGLFLTPHSSSFFLYIYLIFLVNTSKSRFKKLFIFITSVFTQSYTSLIAFLFQWFNYVSKKVKILKKLIPGNFALLVIVISLIFIYFTLELFIDTLQDKGGGVTRFFSAKSILEQLFEPEYYKVLYKNFYPIRYSDYFDVSGTNIDSLASEVGFIKVIVEGGNILGIMTLFFLIKKLKMFRIFMIVSLMHYTHFITAPFFLYLMLYYNNTTYLVKQP